MKFKPVISQDDAAYYVAESQMIEFISENSDMGWNKAIDFMQKNYIICVDERTSLWERRDVEDDKRAKEYSEEQVKWIGAFFEAHPFMNKIEITTNV